MNNQINTNNGSAVDADHFLLDPALIGTAAALAFGTIAVAGILMCRGVRNITDYIKHNIIEEIAKSVFNDPEGIELSPAVQDVINLRSNSASDYKFCIKLGSVSLSGNINKKNQ